MITTDLLIASGVTPTLAKVFAGPLASACRRFDIESRERVSMFLAQALHESAHLTSTEENLYYTTPERIRAVFPSTVKSMEQARELTRRPQALANRVYAGRLGNGDEAGGDGWRFRGRGIFHLTGRTNYIYAGREVGFGYERNPELVALPEHACLTAASFWQSRGCNALADMGDLAGVTRKVNGPAMLGGKERAALYLDVLEALA